MKKRKLNILFVIVSVIVGLVFSIIGELIYRIPALDTPCRVVAILLYFTSFALILGLVILFKAFSSDAYEYTGKVMLLSLIAFIGIVGGSALFEFLYELGGGQPQFNTNNIQYAFLIDDSSSMDSNDPNDERYNAIEQIINNMSSTNQFAVYRFANDTSCSTPMNSVNSSSYQFQESGPNLGGGTEMMKAVDTVISEVADPHNVHTKVIILTDGDPLDRNRYNGVLRQCLNNNVSVSSVGFGAPNESFMTDFADKTGGTYVGSNNISNLINDVQTVVSAKSKGIDCDRDLLGERWDYTSGSFWYGLFRVVLLILLGLIWTVFKMLLVGEKKFTKKGAVVSIVLCSLAALFCELFPTSGFLGVCTRILFCAMWACTLIYDPVYNPDSQQSSPISEAIGNNKDNSLEIFNIPKKEDRSNIFQ